MAMPSNAPTMGQIRAARRLMAHAELESIRLLEAQAVHAPSRPRRVVEIGKRTGGLVVEVKAVPHGYLEGNNRIRILVRYALLARRGHGVKADVAIRVKATFELRYALPDGLGPSTREVGAFSKTNAMLNSWPYWREFVQSVVARMNLPPLTLPLFRLVAPRIEGKAHTQSTRPTQ